MMLNSTFARWCAVASSSPVTCAASAVPTSRSRSVRVRLDVRGERVGGRVGVGEQGLQPHDVGGALVDVGDDAPPTVLAGGEREACADQVGALLAADLVLRDDGAAGGERGDLPRGEQVVDVVEADLPRDGRRERLARVGLVGERGVQVDEPEPGRGVDLGTLVRVEQAAELALRLHRDARGQQVDEAVQDLGLDGPVRRRGDLDLAHDRRTGRRCATSRARAGPGRAGSPRTRASCRAGPCRGGARRGGSPGRRGANGCQNTGPSAVATRRSVRPPVRPAPAATLSSVA